MDKKRGLYIIPFLETFFKCFEGYFDDDKETLEKCIKDFLTNDKVPPSVLKFASEKYDNFFEVINSTLKTRDEVLVETLSKNGIATVKENGVAKTFKEMIKELDKLPEQTKKLTKKRLSTLNKAQAAGYLFSGLVLGLGIPNLNIYITNKLDKKRKAAKAQEKQNAVA